jgi:F0F1-type ATP synthase epsilon subunit
MSDATENLLMVRFISPFETFFEGPADSLSASDKNGPFDVLPGHSSFIGILVNGDVKVSAHGFQKSIGISRGIIHVYKNQVEVFANV